jgi:iron complex transport system ATP-binding protein
MTPPVLLETRGLAVSIGGRGLLQPLDWRVAAGERWCVIGRNAVGKSTLLRALAGLSEPGIAVSGDVLWQGRSARRWSASDAAAMRAFMPQQAVDRFPMPVSRLLELGVVVPGADPAQALCALDLQALASRSVLELSGGERQRVALAQCVVQGAPLHLLDEPVAFQDPAHQGLVARWLGSLRAPSSLVITAHDVNWIARTATHVLALLPDGRCESAEAATLLRADLLEAVYGCRWRNLGGVWVVD